MKGLKLCLVIGSLVAGISSANAARVNFTVTGTLDSYKAAIPWVGVINGVLDPVKPAINGVLVVDLNLPNVGTPTPMGSWTIDYTNISLGTGIVKTIPAATVTVSNPYTTTFDPTNRRLVSTSAGWSTATNTRCIGPAAICGALYVDSDFLGTLDLIFNVDHSAFSGTFTEVDKLDLGGTVTKVYSLTGSVPAPPAVPVPLAGVLFGSALMALGGIARHRNRSC